MKAQNLSISIPNYGCDKNCPYCISKMTGYMDKDIDLMMHNLPVCRQFAERLNVSSVLITGKGEPLFNEQSVFWTDFFLNEFQTYITELQTNGLKLFKDYKNHDFSLINKLLNKRLNIIAFSIDEINLLSDNKNFFHYLKNKGIIIRFTMNITNNFKKMNFTDLLDLCKESYADQVSFRKITIPNYLKESKIALKTKEWIENNIDMNIYDRLIDEFKNEVKNKEIIRIRKLSNGAQVYDFNGTAFTYFDYCIQDENTGDDIRSLIYQENGHGYDNWNSEASILF